LAGFVRYGNAYHPGLACVLSNGGPSKKRMFIGRQYTNCEWTDILGYHSAPVIIDKRGYGNFPVRAMSVGVWVDAAAVRKDDLQKDLYVIATTSHCARANLGNSNVNIYEY
jgi:alpha-amylase